MNSTSFRTLGLAALAVSLVGCNITGATKPPDPFPTAAVSSTPASGKAPFEPSSDAGTPVTAAADAKRLTTLVATRDKAGAFGMARSDPFALTTQERYFETQQATERIFSGPSGFGVFVTPKPDTDEQVVAPEPQPYRRLSGIVVGDSVLAILEEQGKEPVIVTPGMKIPNTPWTVVSIDQDKAVLRRSGNVKPTQIVVRLEVPRDGFGVAPGGGAPGGPPGGPPGGYPGGPPGGYPGGYPGGPPGAVGGAER